MISSARFLVRRVSAVLLPLSCGAACWCAPVSARAATINWGSLYFTDMVDSTGSPLDPGFTFQLGGFTSGFTPSASNVGDWGTNWRVFDEAEYSAETSSFSSSQVMLSDGSSAGYQDPEVRFDFAEREAFLWIRNSAEAVQGSEWLLVRADDWLFPAAGGDCCDNTLPLEWSTSDLAAATPVWGGQGSVSGSGYRTTTESHTLQTYGFELSSPVPEPSSALVGILLVSGLVFRRKRGMLRA